MATRTSTTESHKVPRILLLNPNSSKIMTNAMEVAARNAPNSHLLEIDTYTGPAEAPLSINDSSDIEASTAAVQQHISGMDLDRYDGVLVACFSVHSLVTQLARRHPRMAVTGIFEASVLSVLSLLSNQPPGRKWGIVTTGEFWEQHLTAGVGDLLGLDDMMTNSRFCGVFSTGLSAGDFHTLPSDAIEERLRAATRRLFQKGNVAYVVMGCGGMAGLEHTIRSVAKEVYGEEQAWEVYVVDGVKAGILQLQQLIGSMLAFQCTLPL